MMMITLLMMKIMNLRRDGKLHTTKRPSGLLFLFIKQTTLKVAFKGQARAHLTIQTNLSLCTKMEISHHLQICVQFPVIANCNGWISITRGNLNFFSYLDDCQNGTVMSTSDLLVMKHYLCKIRDCSLYKQPES